MSFSDFYEYPSTLRHIKFVDRLSYLHSIRLSQQEAVDLTKHLTAHFKLPMPDLSFTGRTDRGRYFWHSHRLVIRSSDISTEVLCHELAHHWVQTKMTGDPDGHHGYDFAIRLEWLADEALQYVRELQ